MFPCLHFVVTKIKTMYESTYLNEQFFSVTKCYKSSFGKDRLIKY